MFKTINIFVSMQKNNKIWKTENIICIICKICLKVYMPWIFVLSFLVLKYV